MVTLSNASQYGRDAMGVVIIMGILGTLRLITLYRATRDQRHLRSSIGAALLVAAATAYASSVDLLCLVLLIPGATLVLASRPRFRLRHDEQLPRRVETDAKCYNCGYDLRGTIAAGIDVCPECGERVK